MRQKVSKQVEIMLKNVQRRTFSLQQFSVTQTYLHIWGPDWERNRLMETKGSQKSKMRERER